MPAVGSHIKCSISDCESETRLLLFTPINLQILELLSLGGIMVEANDDSTSLKNKW